MQHHRNRRRLNRSSKHLNLLLPRRPFWLKRRRTSPLSPRSRRYRNPRRCRQRQRLFCRGTTHRTGHHSGLRLSALWSVVPLQPLPLQPLQRSRSRLLPQPQPHRAAPPEPPRSATSPVRQRRPARTSRSRSAASRTRPMRPVLSGVSDQGLGSLRRGLGQQHGQIWKVVRVGRYQTETQAVSASAELTSAANLRGNVIKVR